MPWHGMLLTFNPGHTVCFAWAVGLVAQWKPDRLWPLPVEVCKTCELTEAEILDEPVGVGIP